LALWITAAVWACLHQLLVEACPQTMSPAAITTTLPDGAVAVGVMLGVDVAVLVAVALAVEVALAVFVAVADGVVVAVLVIVTATVPVTVAVGTAVPELVATAVPAGVAVDTEVAVLVAGDVVDVDGGVAVDDAVGVDVEAGVNVADGATVAIDVAVGLTGDPSVKSSLGRLVALSRELNPAASIELGSRTKATSPFPVIAALTSNETHVLPDKVWTVESALPIGPGAVFQVRPVSDHAGLVWKTDGPPFDPLFT